ncbi:MAG: glycosyltransferase family 4 protein [Deltaproteobacteria bacterium]|nr:glycosyltransferase family 4 protein [Deltaproteobacteria bacterium]
MPTVALIGPELYPIPPIRGGAAELFIEKVVDHFTGWRPLVIGVSDPELPVYETRGQAEYHRVPLDGWRRWLYCRYRNYFPLYDRAVARIIRRVRPDLIHVHNRPLLALSLARRSRGELPIILHMHNLYASLGKRERPLPGTPIPVAGFAACSNFVLERERSRLGLGAGLSRVIYNGVETDAFVPRWDQAAGVQEVRRQYGIESEPTVLFAGKLRESKGVHILLRAMTRVWEIAPRAVLVLVGGTEYGRNRTMRETPFMSQLRRDLARAPGRVVLTGFIPPTDMPRAYLLGDVFVGPSQIEEGLGLVFLEAAAAGLPIIATRMGGIPEVVREDFNGLLLRQKDDASELAEKIIGLLSDPPRRQRLGQQGRDWVRTEFSWERIARTLEEFYDEVMELNQHGQSKI